MSVREEDRQRNCPNRGLGIAAAAIGVGVGAAIYYFFNKRSENPDGEGSTSDWTCEQPHALDGSDRCEEDDSYTTISEHSTSDTSMHETSDSSTDSIISVTETEHSFETSSEPVNSSESEMSVDETENNSDSDSDLTQESLYSAENDPLNNIHAEFLNDLFSPNGNPMMSGFITRYQPEPSDSDVEWDITTSSVGVPSENRLSPLRMFLNNLTMIASPIRRRPTEEDQMTRLRDQAFRERSWTVEECSICFDVMLQTQEVMALTCTHRFHQQCILPWLQEQQTCPNCRKKVSTRSLMDGI